MTLEQKVLEQLFMGYIETMEYENDPLTQQAEEVYHAVMEEVKQWFGEQTANAVDDMYTDKLYVREKMGFIHGFQYAQKLYHEIGQ